MMKPPFALEQLMRWYGPSDPVALQDIKQAGCTGVVSALHAIPVGAVWAKDDINAYKSRIESAGLTWTVVESLPVHEDIKSQKTGFEKYIEDYKQSIRNLGEAGIKVVTYNFMPILDWLRTDVSHILPNQSEALLFNKTEYAIFDLYLLKRPGAEDNYSENELEKYKARYERMGEERKEQLFRNMLLGLPGSDISFTADQVLKPMEQYQSINAKQLKSNLIYFLENILPAAEEAGVKMAIHPDDPPYEVLGLPRIMSTEQDIADVMEALPSTANGLCFCTGSFGARADNDIPAMIKKWGNRIFFLHLRNTKRDEEGNFFEANHLEGDTDMFAVMNEVVNIMQHEKRNICMRLDHGHKMLDDLGKTTFPGYSAIGKLKGLAELRGLEYAIHRSLNNLIAI